MHHFKEDAVDSESDFDGFFAWLDVDITCALFDGGLDDVVDVADDGGFGGLFFEVDFFLGAFFDLNIVFVDVSED